MATTLSAKTEDDLRKEIDELQHQQRQVSTSFSSLLSRLSLFFFFCSWVLLRFWVWVRIPRSPNGNRVDVIESRLGSMEDSLLHLSSLPSDLASLATQITATQAGLNSISGVLQEVMTRLKALDRIEQRVLQIEAGRALRHHRHAARPTMEEPEPLGFVRSESLGLRSVAIELYQTKSGLFGNESAIEIFEINDATPTGVGIVETEKVHGKSHIDLVGVLNLEPRVAGDENEDELASSDLTDSANRRDATLGGHGKTPPWPPPSTDTGFGSLDLEDSAPLTSAKNNPSPSLVTIRTTQIEGDSSGSAKDRVGTALYIPGRGVASTLALAATPSQRSKADLAGFKVKEWKWSDKTGFDSDRWENIRVRRKPPPWPPPSLSTRLEEDLEDQSPPSSQTGFPCHWSWR